MDAASAVLANATTAECRAGVIIEADAAAASHRSVAGECDAVEREVALVEDRPARAHSAAANGAVAAFGQAVGECEVLQREGAQRQFGGDAAGDVEEPHRPGGGLRQAAVALERGAVALDGDVAVDRRQVVGAVPVVVHRGEVVRGLGQHDGRGALRVVRGVNRVAQGDVRAELIGKCAGGIVQRIGESLTVMVYEPGVWKAPMSGRGRADAGRADRW